MISILPRRYLLLCDSAVIKICASFRFHWAILAIHLFTCYCTVGGYLSSNVAVNKLRKTVTFGINFKEIEKQNISSYLFQVVDDVKNNDKKTTVETMGKPK